MTINVNDCFFYIKNGANIKQGVISGGIPITRIETLANDTFNRDKMGYAGIHDKKKYTEYILQDGDILMSHINSMAYLGRAVMYKMQKNECIIHGMNLLRLKANRNFILPEYAEYYFKSNTFKKYIKKIAKKSVNQASFSIADLKSIPLFLPNMVEQKKIYNTLNRIDNIISLKNQQLKKLDLLTKSLFVEMFGDPVISSNGKKQVPFSEFIASIRYGTSQPPVFSTNGEFKFIRATNIKKGKIIPKDMLRIDAIEANKIKKCQLTGNEIIIVRSGVNAGDTGIITSQYIGDYAGYDIIVSIDLKKGNPVYFNELINTHYMEQIIKPLTIRSAQPHLNAQQVKELPMVLATLEEQNNFAEVIEQIDKHKLLIID